MANIQKRLGKSGKTSYRALVRLKGHPPQSATFERLTDAKKWASSTEAAIREGRYFKRSESQRKTLQDLIDRYKSTVLPTKPKSAYEQDYQLDWWAEELGPYFLADITPSVLSEAKDKLLASKTKAGKLRSSATVVRYMAALSHAFTIAAKEWQWVEDNPFRNVKKPREPRGRIRYLEKEEIQRLRGACKDSPNPYLETIFILAVSTGMRKGEILGLTWRRVDVQKGAALLTETKNDERRSVPLAGEALAMLKDLRKVRHLHTDLLFPSPISPDRPLKIDAHFRAALEKAGITNYRFHDNRHTAASYLAMNGASLSEIAEVLGHKTLSMVKRYAHLSEAHTSKVVSRMNRELFA